MEKKISLMMIIISVLITAWAFAGPKEKIAVAANAQTPAASVSSQAGRSPLFLLFDEKGKLVETITNPYKEAENSGIAVVDFLAGKGVTTVVAEEFGPRIVQVMKSKGIRVVAFKGSADEAVKKVLQSN